MMTPLKPHTDDRSVAKLTSATAAQLARGAVDSIALNSGECIRRVRLFPSCFDM
ncbi:MAG: hypothetical protein ABI560_00080 [Myxococcales bacterium]